MLPEIYAGCAERGNPDMAIFHHIPIEICGSGDNRFPFTSSDYFDSVSYTHLVKRVGDIEGVSNIFTYATVPVDFSTDNDISDSTLMLGYKDVYKRQYHTRYDEPTLIHYQL